MERVEAVEACLDLPGSEGNLDSAFADTEKVMSTQYEVRSGGYQASFLVQTTDHKKVGWLSIRDLKDRERPMCQAAMESDRSVCSGGTEQVGERPGLDVNPD